jgi:hypothetical protein
MAEDIFKPAGATKASKPDAGGGVIRSVPVYGIVKNNIDPTRSGRIQVYISDLGGNDPDNPANWATVSYMSPFYGFVQPTAPNQGEGDFVANPASYGMWYSPPDLESQVICIFINGDPNYGYYIGAAPKPEALHMVPAIGSSDKIITNNSSESQSYGGASILPVTNINTNNTSTSDDDNFLDLPKPIHSYQAAILFKQGIIRDTLRGPITSSANRESPSRVGWGVSTPGRPIYAGGFTDANIAQAASEGKNDESLRVISRVGGHSIVLDDGDLIGRDNLVRIRSSAGHQLLMSDDGQTIFIIHSNGQSWIEMGKEGTIDLFSTNSFNIRTQGDINFHADNNINIHAKKKLNIKAEDIYIQSEKSTCHNIGSDYKLQTSGKYSHKIAGIMSMQSGGDASFESAGTLYVNGSRINLNSGSGPSADDVQPLQDIAHTDTLFDNVKGYLAAPGLLKSITSRTPAHMPWVNANQGVNVEVSPSTDDNLPSAPNAALERATQIAESSTSASPLSAAGLATVPSVKPVSNSIDGPTTSAIVGALATNAANGPASLAVKTGAGVVPTSDGPVVALGSLAQTPAQLEAAGFLKPGAAVLVDALIKAGQPLNSALTKNLFTGKNGVGDLNAFLNNPAAQISGMVDNLQKSQTSLTNAGILTGSESPVAIAGLVMSGSTCGVPETLAAVKNVTGGTNQPANAGLPGVTNPVFNALNSGNFAAGLSQSSTSGLGSIVGAVAAMGAASKIMGNKNKGATAMAVAAIATTMLPLPNKKPANLKTISAENMAIAEARSLRVADPFKDAKDFLKLTGRIGGGKVNQIAGAVIGGLNAVNRYNNAKNPQQTIGAITGIIGSVGRIGSATGNNNLAKQTRQVNTVINAANQINNSLNTISNAKTVVGQLGGLGRILGSVGQVGRAFGNKNLVRSTRKAGTIISSSQGILRGVDKLTTSKNINTTLGALNSIVRNASRIKGTVGRSSKASGMSMIPGGNLSIGSVVNKSLGKLGIPRNPALASIITSAVTAAINDIAYPKAVKAGAGLPRGIAGPTNFTGPTNFDSLNGIQTDITKSLSGIQSDIVKSLSGIQSLGKNLTTLSISDLNAGEAAQLNAAMGAIGFGGAGAVKMPTVGENTFNDSAVNAQLNSLLEDSRIPAINFGDEPDSGGIAALEAAIQANNAVDAEFNSLESLFSQVETAKQKFYDLESSLPTGSLEIIEAQNEWLQLQEKANRLLDSIENKINY